MEALICQSCGMPLKNEEDFGTGRDGSRNEEYCIYCYKEGAFAEPDITMDGMIGHCVAFLDEFNKDSGTKFSRDEAVAEMKKYFPMLKRWK